MARDEPSRRTQRKQQTTGAEDELKAGGSEFTKPSLFEPRSGICGTSQAVGETAISSPLLRGLRGGAQDGSEDRGFLCV